MVASLTRCTWMAARSLRLSQEATRTAAHPAVKWRPKSFQFGPPHEREAACDMITRKPITFKSLHSPNFRKIKEPRNPDLT